MVIKIIGVVLFWGAAAVGIFYYWYRLQLAGSSRDRLYGEATDGARRDRDVSVADMSFLRRWLFLAGFRSPQAPTVFLVATAVAIACGVTSALFIYMSGLRTVIATGVETVPGGIGQMFLPLAITMSFARPVI